MRWIHPNALAVKAAGKQVNWRPDASSTGVRLSLTLFGCQWASRYNMIILDIQSQSELPAAGGAEERFASRRSIGIRGGGAAGRLDAVLQGQSGVVYFRGEVPGAGGCELCMAGNCGTGQIFVQVTQGERRWVEQFASRLPGLKPGERRAGIRWPDLERAEAGAGGLIR